MSNKLELSKLGHTWIFDIDGTLVKHNGYKIDGHDTLLDGVEEFFKSIPNNDYIILVTSRTDEQKNSTIRFLQDNNIRFNNIIFNLPYGERILVNDKKPSGLEMSKAINLERNEFSLDVFYDNSLWAYIERKMYEIFAEKNPT